jgi:hypothetical protein
MQRIYKLLWGGSIRFTNCMDLKFGIYKYNSNKVIQYHPQRRAIEQIITVY